MRPTVTNTTRGNTSYTIVTPNIGKRPDRMSHEEFERLGREAAPPKPRPAPEDESKFAFKAFPPEHAKPAGRIRELVQQLWQELGLTPAQAAVERFRQPAHLAIALNNAAMSLSNSSMSAAVRAMSASMG
jgi:hypothetical protein